MTANLAKSGRALGSALHVMRSCAYRLCHPNVVPMETAEPSDRCDTPDCLRRSMERSILVERKVRAHPIVVGGIIRQQMAEVSFSQHYDMVDRAVPAARSA